MLRKGWLLLWELIKTEYLAISKKSKKICLVFHIYDSLRF